MYLFVTTVVYSCKLPSTKLPLGENKDIDQQARRAARAREHERPDLYPIEEKKKIRRKSSHQGKQASKRAARVSSLSVPFWRLGDL